MRFPVAVLGLSALLLAVCRPVISADDGRTDIEGGVAQIHRPGTAATPGSASEVGAVGGKGLFYMYDLDRRYWWRYPEPHVNCNKSMGYLPADAHRYSGIGEPIDLDRGLFSTWHFSMFNSLHNRLKRSSRRTRDPEKASFFVVPYDMGLDGFIKQADCSIPKWPLCTSKLTMGVMDMLRNSVHYNRYKGADHLLIWSLGEGHPWPGACKHLMERFCANCTLTSYWMHPRQRGHHFVSLPFPSSFHFHDALRTIPWTAGPAADRPIFSVYAGSVQTLTPDHTKVRRAVVEQCQKYSRCTHLDLGHTSTDSRVMTAVSTYKKSIFCLCPPGDDPARKALMDMILMGCIPVLMHHSSLHNQYPYHLNESIAQEISVFIPGVSVRFNSLNIFTDVLQKISADVISRKQRAIERIAHRLQYAVPPLDLLRDEGDETVWDSPVEDAVDIFMDAMVTRAGYRRSGNFYGESVFAAPAYVMNPHTWVQKYKSIYI